MQKPYQFLVALTSPAIITIIVITTMFEICLRGKLVPVILERAERVERTTTAIHCLLIIQIAGWAGGRL